MPLTHGHTHQSSPIQKKIPCESSRVSRNAGRKMNTTVVYKEEDKGVGSLEAAVGCKEEDKGVGSLEAAVGCKEEDKGVGSLEAAVGCPVLCASPYSLQAYYCVIAENLSLLPLLNRGMCDAQVYWMS